MATDAHIKVKVVIPDEFVLCAKYRQMILRLLENGHKTNIPQEIRNAAYDLLDEYFKTREVE